jgi:hypothetical protein
MVDYYGPWRDGPLTTELHDAATGTVIRTTEVPVAQPYASGWFIGGWKRYNVTDSASLTTPGGLSDPPEPEPIVSQEAWSEARGKTLNASTPIAALPISDVAHSGGLVHGLGEWTQNETWTLRGSFWKLAYAIPSDVDWIAAVAPPFEDWPEGAVNVEVEQPGPQSAFWTELVYAEMIGTGSPKWPLYHKAAKKTGGWLGDDPTSLLSIEGSTDLAVAIPVDAVPVEISVEALSDLVAEYVAGGMRDPGDPRWASGAVVHRALWPGVYGPQDPPYREDSPGGAGTYGSVELSYRPPRWRYVYDQPLVPPYRRITQRGDALAGGARRIGGRVKTIQGSNRRGAGSVV